MVVWAPVADGSTDDTARALPSSLTLARVIPADPDGRYPCSPHRSPAGPTASGVGSAARWNSLSSVPDSVAPRR
jgi:hypothetical protein